MATKTRKPINRIKPLIEVDAVESARQDLVSCQMRRTEVESRINSLHLANGSRVSWTEDGERVIEKVRAGEALEVGNNRTQELSSLYKQRQSLTRAIHIAQKKYNAAVTQAKSELAQDIRPMYSERVQAIADAALVLRQAVLAEQDFRDEVEQGGADVFGGLLRSAAGVWYGSREEHNPDQFALFIREHVEAGNLPKSYLDKL